MGPGDRAAVRSAPPIVSAMPADDAPVIDITSPALALSSSILPTPLRLKILVTLLSAPGAPATNQDNFAAADHLLIVCCMPSTSQGLHVTNPQTLSYS